MTPLRVLLPLALLVALTLAEYPSSNQIRLYGKEDSISLPNNPVIENEGDKADKPETPSNTKPVGDDKETDETKTPADDKKSDGTKTPADDKKSDGTKTPANDKESDGTKTPADDKKSDGTKTPADDKKSDEIKAPADDKKSDDKKPDDKKPDDKQPDDKKPDDKQPDDKQPDDKKPDDKKPDDKNPDDKKPDGTKTPADDKKSDGTKTPADDKKSDEIKAPADDKKSDDKKPDDKKPDDKQPDDKKPDDKQPDDKKPDDKKPDDKKPDDKNPDDKKPDDNNESGKNPDKPEDPKEADYRLPENIKPIRYVLDLKVNQHDLPKKDYKYEGSVSIDFSAETATKVIKLHYDKKSIEVLERKLVETITDVDIPVTEKEEKNLDVSISEFTVATDLKPKTTYTLTLKYKGTVNENSQGFYKGSYFNAEGKKRWYAVTHFEPLGARSAFPCFDEPALKATFDITITHSIGYTAISNMPSEHEDNIGKDWRKVIFKRTPVMSTYLVAFAITDFEETGDKAPVYSRKDAVEMAEYAANTGEDVLKQLEEYTGIKFSLPRISQLALPLLRPGAMENWGLVTYRETALLYNQTANATIDQQKVASIIAHEFAHQWFGNLVSPKWWEYIWLNEGFATYFQYYIVDKINPNWRFMDQFNVAALQSSAFIYDADWTKTRSMDHKESNEKEIGDMFDTIAYQKAASVIRMFVHVLGEDKFQKGIQKYLEAHKGGVATSEDLYKALDEVAEKDSLPDGTDVKKVFGDWATKKGYPVITVTKDSKTGKVTIAQKPFYLETPSENTKNIWYIPLNYAQENGDFEDTTVQEWLTSESTKITKNIDKDGWIIFNKQQTGYYRVNYNKENWIAIANFLNSDNFTTIHALNRAQLIDDALNLAHVGQLEFDVALSLLEFLVQETDYIVWKSAFAALGTLNKLLAPTEFYSEFSKYLVTVTDTLMQNLTYTPEPEEAYDRTLLRVDAIKWACDSGSEVCKAHATEEVNNWLTDPNNNDTLPRDLKKVLLCGALRNASFEEWKRVFDTYTGSTNTEEKAVILSALGCSLSEDTLKYLLNLAIQQDSIFTGRILEVIRTVYSSSSVGVQVTLNFILENIDKLLTYDTKFYDNLETYINELGSRVVDNDDVTKLHAIVATEIIPSEKTKDALDVAEKNVKWVKKNGKDINNWFGAYNTVTEPPPVTTTKKNGAGSLSFTTLLLAAPLVLARLR